MRGPVLIVVFVLLVAAGLLLQVPPSVVAPLLAQSTGGAVQLVDTEGTLWHGSGALALGETRLPFAWTTDARALSGGRLVFRLVPAVDGGTPRGSFSAGPGAVEFTGIELALPAHAVSPNLPLRELALGGDIALAVPQLARRGNVLDGEAALTWQRARIVAPGQPAIDLGNLSLRLAGRGEELAGPLANEGGAVALAGELALGLHRGVSGSVLATPRRPDDAPLVRLLSAIGRPEQGGWRIELHAKAP